MLAISNISLVHAGFVRRSNEPFLLLGYGWKTIAIQQYRTMSMLKTNRNLCFYLVNEIIAAIRPLMPYRSLFAERYWFSFTVVSDIGKGFEYVWHSHREAVQEDRRDLLQEHGCPEGHP